MKRRGISILKLAVLLMLISTVVPLWAQQNKSTPDRDEQLRIIQNVLAYSADSSLEMLNPLIDELKEEKDIFYLSRAQSLKTWILTIHSRYEESLKLAHQVLREQQKLEDSVGIALTLNRIGIANIQFERYEDARHYIDQARDYFTALDDTNGLYTTHQNLGVISEYEGKIQEAIRFYNRSAELALSIGDKSSAGFTLYNIADLHLNISGPDSAEIYMEKAKAMFEQSSSGQVPSMVKFGFAQIFLKKQDYKQALQYATEMLKEAQENEHSELILEAHKILAEIYFHLNQFEEAYASQRDYSKMKEEVDSANSAARVAEVEERYKVAEREAEISRLSAQNLRIENEAQKSNLLALYSLMGTLVVGSGLGLMFVRRRQRQKIKDSQLKAQMAEVKLIALRSQMNPHFIFNCINTAQNFVISARKAEAYEYLSQFARLLRLVLENSDKTYVPVDEEVEQLQLYIQLEQVRFQSKFQYHIHLDPELQDSIYKMPGMILQPLVENAILHGLVNRNDGGGCLKLCLTKKQESVFCVVEDNGVGRAHASAIKNKKEVHYQSAALPNIEQRLKDLEGSALTFIDLEEDATPAGTRVEVSLPLC